MLKGWFTFDDDDFDDFSYVFDVLEFRAKSSTRNAPQKYSQDPPQPNRRGV